MFSESHSIRLPAREAIHKYAERAKTCYDAVDRNSYDAIS
jgi:hypothetical protein